MDAHTDMKLVWITKTEAGVLDVWRGAVPPEVRAAGEPCWEWRGATADEVFRRVGISQIRAQIRGTWYVRADGALWPRTEAQVDAELVGLYCHGCGGVGDVHCSILCPERRAADLEQACVDLVCALGGCDLDERSNEYDEPMSLVCQRGCSLGG